MNRICVLGAFGYRDTLFDGQTIKTRNLLDLLVKEGLGSDYYDTQDFNYSKVSIVKMFVKVCRADVLFYLPAQNNLRYIFPIVYALCRLFRTDIHYFVVGGWLKEFLADKPGLVRRLGKIEGIHSETRLMKEALETTYGFKNVDIFPNFRMNDFVPTMHHEDGKLKAVFMARVVKMKGLDTLFAMGEKIVESGLDDRITLDFFGPIQNEDNDEEFFREGLTRFPFMQYHGPLEPEDIYKTLEQFDVMLLPTHFFTEGLPGSILDAYISGIPVIVTKWKHATEFVEDGKSGIIIPFEDDGTALYKSVVGLLDNPSKLMRMKEMASIRWCDFSSEKAWDLLKDICNN